MVNMLKKFDFEINELRKIEGYSCMKDSNFKIYSVSTIYNPHDNTLIFIKKFDKGMIGTLRNLHHCLIIINKTEIPLEQGNNVLIKTENPRLEYAKILNYIMNIQHESNYRITSNSYAVGENVSIGKDTTIEPFATIDHDVVIGSNCIIKSGARINKYCVIGDNCCIRENSVIGGEGFGIERAENEVNFKIPHLGGVIIGNNVEVGALSSVVSGTIEPTVIEDYVKIDDSVFIAHNCKIDKGTFIIANAEISGSVRVGECSWIGPGSCIIQKVSVGKNVTVGIGAVVTKDIKDNSIVAGNPADNIENLKEIRRWQKEYLKRIK